MAIDFPTYLEMSKGGRPFDTSEIMAYISYMADEARKITFELNRVNRTKAETNSLLGQLIGKPVDLSVRIFIPLFSCFGKNITLGKDLFINSNCHFQDLGGITIGDGCFIGHHVIFDTTYHDVTSSNRQCVMHGPIVLGKNVWIGSSCTILPGVTIGGGSIVGAGAVVTEDVAPMTIVGGNPAKFIRAIEGKNEFLSSNHDDRKKLTHGGQVASSYTSGGSQTAIKMDLPTFHEHVKNRRPFETPELAAFVFKVSDETRGSLCELNGVYHTREEIHALLEKLVGKPVDPTVQLIPPIYSDFGKNITLGKDIFLNSGCHFQDQGGVTIGDGCFIGRNVVFATINHDSNPKKRKRLTSAPIVVGKNVLIGASCTILPGVTIGDGSIVGAGAVVTKDVAPLTVVAGVPAKCIRTIHPE